MDIFWKRSLAALLVTTALSSSLVLTSQAFAQDSGWSAAPPSNDFNAGANWLSGAVPAGTAMFGFSNTRSLTISAFTSVGSLHLGDDALSFNFAIGSGVNFNLTGAGIVNNSLAGSASITNNSGGNTTFLNTSTAGSASITNNGGGATSFINASTAGSASITNNGGALTQFVGFSTAGSASITTNSGAMVESW